MNDDDNIVDIMMIIMIMFKYKQTENMYFVHSNILHIPDIMILDVKWPLWQDALNEKHYDYASKEGRAWGSEGRMGMTTICMTFTYDVGDERKERKCILFMIFL